MLTLRHLLTVLGREQRSEVWLETQSWKCPHMGVFREERPNVQTEGKRGHD